MAGEITKMLMTDETGQKMASALNDIYNVLNNEYNGDTFGFIEHLDILSPANRIEYTDANRNFAPLTVDKSTGAYALNDWNGFPVLSENKPWMVKSDGTPDYRLDESDYTKKLDGSDSDVANSAYDGGAFSWIPRIYKYEAVNGNDRIVKFSFKKKPGFEPTGFVDKNGDVLRGRWLPMFYASVVDNKATCISGTQPSTNLSTAAQKTAVDGRGTRANFLGGAFVETLTDLLMMFAGTSDLQDAYGNGNMSGYVNDSSKNYGVLANAVVGGGQFFGTSDGKSLNKIFHSIVLGSYQQWMRDPYELVVNGRVKVSKNYVYDLTGESYFDTGIDVPDGTSGWKYPLDYVTVEGYGSVPNIKKLGGSTATGACDGTYTRDKQSILLAVAFRFGNCNYGSHDGVRARNWANDASFSYWFLGFAVLLDPPADVAA